MRLRPTRPDAQWMRPENRRIAVQRPGGAHAFNPSSRILLPLAGLLMVACAVAAQTAQSPAPFDSGTTVLHATSSLVLVDVVVTDHGKLVHGIDRSRFHIFEDGHEQSDRPFEEHQPAPTSPHATAAAVQIAALPPHIYTNVSPYPDTGVVNVLLLDALNTPMAGPSGSAQGNGRIPGQDSFGHAHCGLHAGLAFANRRPASPPTPRPWPGDEEAKRPRRPTRCDRRSRITRCKWPRKCEQDGGPDSRLPGAPNCRRVDRAIRSGSHGHSNRSTREHDHRRLEELARYLAAIPGRKNLIWFSGSFPDNARS